MFQPFIDPLVKIACVVQLIEQKMALSPKGGKISIPLAKAIEPPLMTGDMRAILSKLEQDEKVLIVHQCPGALSIEHTGVLTLTRVRSTAFLLTPNAKFPAYAKALRTQLETAGKNNPTLKEPPSLINQSADRTSLNADKASVIQSPLVSSLERVLIRFDDLSRHILLNDCFLIAQPAYDSENYRFFDYVWKHPDRLITLDEFNQKLEEPLKKPIAKILENLNFRGPLKDAFFQVSKTSVLFTPVRTVEALTAAGLYPLRLFSTQKTD